MKSRGRKITMSMKYWHKAEELIPCGTQTLSKAPSQFVKGVYPIYLKSGKGSRVFDVDDNEYIDYPMALGPIILGYAYPSTIKAVTKQMKEGNIFSLMHPLEVEVAKQLTKIIPCAEMVRFGKNGADATAAAVRVSRAYTGREKIASCGYHGWNDWFIISTSRNKGVPKILNEYIHTFEYNNIQSLEKVFNENKDEIAAVIMEPMSLTKPNVDFLENVRDLAHKNGALLIFDEIVTGFRFALGGAQEYFRVTPDLGCFGKAMANGMPISVVVGRRDIMRKFEDVFFSTTFGGELSSLAASLDTIREMKEKNVVKHIYEKGKKLQDGYNKLVLDMGLEKYTQCIGLPAHFLIVFKNEKGEDLLGLKSLFFQECVKRGILFGNAMYISFSHSDRDIDITLKVCGEALGIIKDAIKYKKVEKMLKGEPAQVVFRQRS